MTSVEYTTIRFQDLTAGKYRVQKYKPIITKNHRKAYIVTAEHNNKRVEFWADIVLSDYIKSEKPTKEFEIIVIRQEISEEGLSLQYPNSVTIPGYLDEVVLSK